MEYNGNVVVRSGYPNLIMLIGEYRHTLDDKNRLALPAKFRKELGKQVVITYGFDTCLFVYPKNEWASLSGQLSSLRLGQSDARALERFFFGGAVETDVDSLGRVLVPDFLREHAGLKTKTVVVGVHNRLEVWDEKRWKDYITATRNQADTLAEKLADKGAL